LGIGALVLICAAAVIRPDRMMVEEVEFVGHQRATAAELRHLVNVRNGSSIWQADLGAISGGAASHPWVKRATAVRRYPATVEVQVEEYSPVALLHFDGRFYYVDPTGAVFLTARADDLDYPVITGVDVELERRHPELPGLVVADALWLLRTLDSRNLIKTPQVSEVSFARTRGMTVQLRGSSADGRTARVVFGLGNFERQIDHLATLLDDGLDLTRPLSIDLAPPAVAIVQPLDSVAAGGIN